MALFIGALAVWLAVRVVPVLLLVFLAILIAVFLSAVTDLLGRRFGIGRGLGLTLATIGTTGAVVGLGALFIPPVVEQTRALITGLPQTLASLQAALERLGQEYPVLRDSALADPQSGLVNGVLADVTEYLRGAIVPYLRVGGRLLLDSAAVLVMAIYFAHRPLMYRDGLLALVSPRQRALAGRIVVDMAATLRAWVTGQLLAMVLFAAFTAIGLWALGVPYWLAFGLFAGVAALVPFFGTHRLDRAAGAVRDRPRQLAPGDCRPRPGDRGPRARARTSSCRGSWRAPSRSRRRSPSRACSRWARCSAPSDSSWPCRSWR